MPSAVEQLENGIRVQCADGVAVDCKPLTLKDAKRIIALWNQRFAPKPPETEPDQVLAWAVAIASARIEVAKVFGDLYPTLAEHISPGDVEVLVPDFFWRATGASVPATESASPPTGTPSIASTAPPTAASPTP